MGGLSLVARRGLLGGASLAAILATMAAAPAAAQQVGPGSAQCPRSGAVVNCSGALPGGFTSFVDNTMTELNFDNLTVPIAPPTGAGVIDIRMRNNLLIDLDSSVIVTARNPVSSIVRDGYGAIFIDTSALTFGTRNFNLTSAATVNLTVDVADSANGGAYLLRDARNVDFLNSGAITVVTPNRTLASPTSGLTNEKRISAISIEAVERITLRNSGRLSVTGSSAIGMSLRGRNIDVINTGAIDLSGADYSLSAFRIRADATPTANASISLVNEAAITSTATNIADPAQDNRSSARLDLFGGGAVNFVNRGAITNVEFVVSANDQGGSGSTAPLTVSVTNDGVLHGAAIYALSGGSQSFTAVHQGPTSVSLINRASFDRSNLWVGANGENVTARLENSGDAVFQGEWDDEPGGNETLGFTSAILRIVGTGSITGSAATTLLNSGDLTASDFTTANGAFALIWADSSHSLAFTNSGALRATNMPSVNGIELRLGYGVGSLVQSTPLFFNSTGQIENSGAIDLSGSGNAIFGLFNPYAFGDIAVANGAPITIANSQPASAFSTGGIVLSPWSDASIANSGAIGVTTSNTASGAPVGVFFAERSLADSIAPTGTSSSIVGYDHAADLGSRITINTSADITASGPNGYGVFGVLGITINDSDSRYYSAYDFGGPAGGGPDPTLDNDRASAAITVGAASTVAGGAGRGAAIGVQGAGTVILTNNGVLIGRGDANGGAVLLGDLEGADTFFGTVPQRGSGLFLNLVDSVNTGTIRSDAGYGVWAQNGAITHFVNSGLIFGGTASIRAARASSIDNHAGGVLDGRIMLEGAGSSLVNSGTVRATSASAAAHIINGAFTQSADGALVLRRGDTMNVAGDFNLNGVLDVGLGAASTSPIITVGGALTLDGLLNVTDAGGFGGGIYRLFNYGGALTDNGLDLGTLPNGARGSVQTAIAGQINLLVSGGRIQFWDGGATVGNNQVNGGSGAWNSSATNWTGANGDVNEGWFGEFAVFQAAPGTVTIAPGGVSSSGLQFAVSGYRVEGGTLTLTAPATLRVGDGSAAGAGYTATITSVIAGPSGIDKTDLGTLILTGANTYAGGTRVSGGVLEVNADGALGAAAGGVTLDGGILRAAAALSSARGFTIGAGGGTLDAQGNAVTLSGVIGGGGAFTKTGTGTLTLSGNSGGYAGPTNLTAGALVVSGSLGGTVNVNAGTLTVSGALTGGANVNAGTLNLGGTIAGTTTIAAGATLRGAGTLNNLILSGTLAPGNSVGTLNASGNVTLRAGSTFEVEVAAAGGADRLAVTGSATIEGGTVRVVALDPETQYVDGARYTFLTAAGGRTGTFASLSETSAFLDFTLGYDATSAFLTVDVVRTFPSVAASFNQTGVSTALAALSQTPGSDSLAVYNTILLLDAAPARDAFDASSGEIYPAMMSSLLRQGASIAEGLGARGREGGADGWRIWGSIGGNSGDVDSDGNGASFEFDDVTAEIGIDKRGSSNHWAVGAALGYASGSADLPGRRSSGDMDGWHVGAYGRVGTGGGGFTAHASGAIVGRSAEVGRSIQFGALSRIATSDVDLDATALQGDLQYGFPISGGWSFGPMVSAGYASVDLDSFAESGASALNLSGDGDTQHDSHWGAGGFLNWQGDRGWFDANVQYLMGGERIAEAELRLAGSSAGPFRVRSAGSDSGAVLYGVTGRFDLGRGWTLGAQVRGLAGGGAHAIGGSATLGLAF